MVLPGLRRIKESVLYSSKVRLGSYLVRKLNTRKGDYRLRYPNDLAFLSRSLIPGDVILVEGDHSISDWIKLYTSHTWSHCALFVGDKAKLVKTKTEGFVEEKPNLVEAIIGRGVILGSLSKYRDCNLRVCRPRGLTRKQRETVVGFALGKVGMPYDQENVLQFVSLPFTRNSSPADDIGEPERSKYTCSSLIASAFGQVDHDVLHFCDKGTGKLVPYHYSQIQPKDFDLSPYFEIVKVHWSTRTRSAGFFRRLFLRQKSA